MADHLSKYGLDNPTIINTDDVITNDDMFYQMVASVLNTSIDDIKNNYKLSIQPDESNALAYEYGHSNDTWFGDDNSWSDKRSITKEINKEKFNTVAKVSKIDPNDSTKILKDRYGYDQTYWIFYKRIALISGCIRKFENLIYLREDNYTETGNARYIKRLQNGDISINFYAAMDFLAFKRADDGSNDGDNNEPDHLNNNIYATLYDKLIRKYNTHSPFLKPVNILTDVNYKTNFPNYECILADTDGIDDSVIVKQWYYYAQMSTKYAIFDKNSFKYCYPDDVQGYSYPDLNSKDIVYVKIPIHLIDNLGNTYLDYLNYKNGTPNGNTVFNF